MDMPQTQKFVLAKHLEERLAMARGQRMNKMEAKELSQDDLLQHITTSISEVMKEEMAAITRFQEELKWSFATSCKAMLEQVDASFQKAMVEHSSSITQTLCRELTKIQRNILGSDSSTASNDELEPEPEPAQDPRNEPAMFLSKRNGTHYLLTRLISECKYDEAFTLALESADLPTLSWLCSQVDLVGILSMVPLPLNQRALMSLLQQLSHDLKNDTSQKLNWMSHLAAAIDPTDPTIAFTVRPMFEQLYQILHHQLSGPQFLSIRLPLRLLLLVITSILTLCK